MRSRLLRVEIIQDCARVLVFDAEKNIDFVCHESAAIALSSATLQHQRQQKKRPGEDDAAAARAKPPPPPHKYNYFAADLEKLFLVSGS